MHADRLPSAPLCGPTQTYIGLPLPLATCQTCRDLAEQTHNNFTAFRKYLVDPALRNELLVGGTNPQPALRALQEGVDIIVGTPGGLAGGLAGRLCWRATVLQCSAAPLQALALAACCPGLPPPKRTPPVLPPPSSRPGRVMDFIEQGKLATDAVKFFVLDEAGASGGSQAACVRLRSARWQWQAVGKACAGAAQRRAALCCCIAAFSKCSALPCLPISCTYPDRLLDTGNQELILKMFRRFPKAGAGVARLQVRRAAGGVVRLRRPAQAHRGLPMLPCCPAPSSAK